MNGAGRGWQSNAVAALDTRWGINQTLSKWLGVRRPFSIRRRWAQRCRPHTPWSDAVIEGVVETLAATGHVAQMRLATSTPTPSLGKKVEGGWSLQLPSFIQGVGVSMSGKVAMGGESGGKENRWLPLNEPFPKGGSHWGLLAGRR